MANTGQPLQQPMDTGEAAAAAVVNPNDEADEMEAAAQEVVEIEEEALDPQRDFVDARDEWAEDVAEEMLGGFGGRVNNDTGIFITAGKAPVLPPFILNCMAKSRPMNADEAAIAVENPWELPVPERWRLYR